MMYARMILLSFLALTAGSSLLFAQPKNPSTDSLIASLSDKLQNQYVFADKAKEVTGKLQAAHRQKKYAAYQKDELAAVLTKDLQEWSGDKHLRVAYSPQVLPPVEEVQMTMPPAEKAGYAEYLRHDNYGIGKVDVLKGNIGYLEFKYFCDPEFAGDSYSAMMSYVAGTDALIIDLRRCMGSMSPDAIPFLCSYLFEKPTHLNDLYWRKGNVTTQSWTYAYVPGRRFLNKPVYVLTSKASFSGAEELAYDLKNLKRATLVGETTGGGANAGGDLTLTAHFNAFIPVGRAINPITKTNWEGVGVEPDSLVRSGKALQVATLAALKNIFQQTTDEGYKNYLAGVIAEAEANIPQYQPVVFELEGYTEARDVYVAGSFNDWSPKALPMKRKGNKWVATGEAEAGRLSYKFIVDGNWITDPANKETEIHGSHTNSVRLIEKQKPL